MAKTFDAVFENGVLKPMEPLELLHSQHVQVTISTKPEFGDSIADYFKPEEWEAAKQDDISLEQVRAALASISGSLSATIIESREERF